MMMSNKSLGKFLFHVMATLAIAYSVSAQSDQPQDPNSKSRNFKEEVKRVYQDWVKKDVAYIITSEEKKAFTALKSDEERENFIEAFWRRRDPNPDTEENEYREEYYEQIGRAHV